MNGKQFEELVKQPIKNTEGKDVLINLDSDMMFGQEDGKPTNVLTDTFDLCGHRFPFGANTIKASFFISAKNNANDTRVDSKTRVVGGFDNAEITLTKLDKDGNKTNIVRDFLRFEYKQGGVNPFFHVDCNILTAIFGQERAR